MISTLSPETYFYLIAALVAAGVIGGYVSGLFGIGGGTVLVPAFLTIFPYFGTHHDVVMHSAVGTCLALIVPGAVMSARKQRALGNLDSGFLRTWIPAVLVGVVAGALLIRFTSTTVLKLLFTTYLVSCTAYAALERNGDEGGAGVPEGMRKWLGGCLIGGFSVLLGVGGGTFTVPFLRWSRYPLKKAIATSSATGLAIGAIGALGAIEHGWGVAGRPPHSLGYVNLLAFLVLAPIFMVLAPHGSRTANALPDTTLKHWYVLFLAVVSAYMLYQLYAGYVGRLG